MRNKFFVYNVPESKLVTGLGKYVELKIKGKGLTEIEKENLGICIKELIDFSFEHGFYGNLWQSLLAYFLLMDENPYTLSIERVKDAPENVSGGVYELALRDIEIIRNLFLYDIGELAIDAGVPAYFLTDYAKGRAGSTFNETIRDMMMEIRDKLSNTGDTKAFIDVLNDFYSKYGVGRIGLHKAFRIDDSGNLYPINKIANVHLDDLIGLETQKEELTRNTKAFISGKPANNCLLYGDAGTGKSSSVKAIANEYYPDGLRIVEVYKHQLKAINDVVARLKGRNYSFILYMDDLSFEEFETEYKYLKALIEGGLEKKPENILIYATSNRRHLIRESFGERNDDVNKNDTMQEKISLFSRFGVSIYYGRPDKKEYNRIVLGLKEKMGLDISEEEILAMANRWEMEHGTRSGRSAEQLIGYILGNTD